MVGTTISVLTGLAVGISLIVAFAFFMPSISNEPEVCGNQGCHYFFANDTSYQESYAMIDTPERRFTGVVTYEIDEKCQSMILQRCLPYKLDGTNVYGDREILARFVGQNVEVIGKRYSFGLEGYHLEEIWPVRIRLLN